MTGALARSSANYVLEINRVLEASVQNVWRCWTEPKLMEEWFCPKPWRATEIKIDLRPGGEMTSVFRGPDGESFPQAGVYLEIVPMKRLVSTDAFRAGWVPSERAFMTTDVRLEEAGNGRAHFIWRALHWTEETMKQHQDMGFEAGWGAATDQLEVLARTL
jgi:uncharacterized protein YndB with AHSA1/START domain